MTNKREKRKRIFYVPGIISLFFIPVFCLVFWYKAGVFKKESCIDIAFSGESLTKRNLLPFKRNYQFFNFNNTEKVELENLKKLQIVLRELNRENDTVNGVQIHLGNKVAYEVYVRILDILAIEQMSNYEQYNNDFFVLMLPKPKIDKNVREITPLTCGLWEANKECILKERKERQFQYVVTLYKKYWYLFLGYLGIVLLNIFALVKFNKTK